MDGNFGTRWASAFSDPQYIIVDLGSVQSIGEILLYWEAAYGKAYLVQLSDDGTNYRTIYTEMNGDGGIDKITTSENSRYVKILGLQRGTQYGYSLFEIVVHGTPSTDVQAATLTLPTVFSLGNNYPNPFNPVTIVDFQLPVAAHVKLNVFDILGREVEVLVNEKKDAGAYSVRFDASGLPSGVYFYRMQAGDFSQTRKLLLLK